MWSLSPQASRRSGYPYPDNNHINKQKLLSYANLCRGKGTPTYSFSAIIAAIKRRVGLPTFTEANQYNQPMVDKSTLQ